MLTQRLGATTSRCMSAAASACRAFDEIIGYVSGRGARVDHNGGPCITGIKESMKRLNLFTLIYQNQ
jgi:hypothetical protein